MCLSPPTVPSLSHPSSAVFNDKSESESLNDKGMDYRRSRMISNSRENGEEKGRVRSHWLQTGRCQRNRATEKKMRGRVRADAQRGLDTRRCR
ncbi:hypothetical protein WR25_07890 [Diploscapter pachys]|uniref:Uncharacterized protein n=1 Tax=Diploscapter pachys TaxID=2018661 RepID=A0A2A2LQU7_9BILA|nr:hypothetical protein WR25_07890 [Diploscapter pachys]